MRFSLICGTAGRMAELEQFVKSVAGQTYRDFELIVVDQNTDDRAARILTAAREGITVRHVRALPGHCAALNLGIKVASGDVLGFPDDDCTYGADLLEEINRRLEAHAQWDGITMRTVDEQGKPSVARWSRYEGRITKSNVSTRSIMTSMFFRRRVVEKVGGFDESIGIGGGTWMGGADPDYLHRVVRVGFFVQYVMDLTIAHPQSYPESADAEALANKRYTYGWGEGMIARKYGLPAWYVGAALGLPLARAMVKGVQGKRMAARDEWLAFKGRWDGWIKTRPVEERG